MGLFNWLRSKRSPPPLPVRYGLGPPPARKPPAPDELCPLCCSEVTEVRRVGHWSEYDGSGGSWWRGRCSACDTIVTRIFGRNESPAWRAPVVPRENLGAVVPEEELQALTSRFARLILFDQNWAEFLATRQPGDEVWRLTRAGERESFAIVRQGRALDVFLAPAPDLERMLLERAGRESEPGAAPARRK